MGRISALIVAQTQPLYVSHCLRALRNGFLAGVPDISPKPLSTYFGIIARLPLEVLIR
jgi:hypothetical protein